MKKLTAADTSAAVDAFIAELDHPHAAAVQALRTLILAADPRIADGVKWNAPSYRTSEYFATTHLRAKVGIGIVLHLGAKVRDTGRSGLSIDDPTGMLTWLAKDRAMVTFEDQNDVRLRSDAFQSLIREWIRYV